MHVHRYAALLLVVLMVAAGVEGQTSAPPTHHPLSEPPPTPAATSPAPVVDAAASDSISTGLLIGLTSGLVAGCCLCLLGGMYLCFRTSARDAGSLEEADTEDPLAIHEPPAALPPPSSTSPSALMPCTPETTQDILRHLCASVHLIQREVERQDQALQSQHASARDPLRQRVGAPSPIAVPRDGWVAVVEAEAAALTPLRPPPRLNTAPALRQSVIAPMEPISPDAGLIKDDALQRRITGPKASVDPPTILKKKAAAYTPLAGMHPPPSPDPRIRPWDRAVGHEGFDPLANKPLAPLPTQGWESPNQHRSVDPTAVGKGRLKRQGRAASVASPRSTNPVVSNPRSPAGKVAKQAKLAFAGKGAVENEM
eukprot:TRINITY_DN24690_c0_g1_i1.p1 TRINITY_DN24690_c0_g1~~TRINITY_DN24690_c0_g1_i1.p1  ORF type:complete len:389 (+),score=32.77 TRINITY_DN24690_c0_g1_i1:62-1168(+)